MTLRCLRAALWLSAMLLAPEVHCAQAPADQPGLNEEQQRAVGIRVANPVSAAVPERSDALGTVLDSSGLSADLGESAATAAAEKSASTEAARLHALYQGGAGASLKAVEAAQAEQVKAQAQAQAAAARLAVHWGAIDSLPAATRKRVIEASTRGRSLLLRADLPGRHALGVLPGKALIDVDGLLVPGRILGALRESTESQSAGLLIEIPDPPPGLAPGARVPVSLFGGARSGLLLPREAILYDESGTYVYKELPRSADPKRVRYAPVKVTLLAPVGDGWLVSGVDDDDRVVVHGAGVLWSLQSMGAHPADDDDD